MKVRSKLNLVSSVSLSVVLFLVPFLLWSFAELNKVDRNRRLADEIQELSFEMRLLNNEHLFFGEERPWRQWEAKSEKARGLLKAARERFTNENERALLTEIQNNFDDVVNISRRISVIDGRSQGVMHERKPFSEGERILISQLLLKEYVLRDGIVRMQDSVRKAGRAAMERTIYLLAALIATTTLTTIGIVMFVNRVFSKRIAVLREGTEILGSGRLDHRIEMKGEDEFSELARATNDMAAKLRESHTSVENLRKEIDERALAEQEKEKLQAQLQQAMKMEAVGRLAGGVAHDFNNILTAIMGNLSLALVKLPLSEQVSSMLVEANKAAERAARLTQQLLAFSRKQIIEPKVLHLNELIAGLAPMLSRLIGEHIEFKTVPGGGLGLVKVDPSQFEQILVNLAVNARDAMPDGGKLFIETANVDLGDIYCAGHPEARPGRFVMLAVSDTGHGMSEEVRKHLFEPFFTTKPRGTGTGLGLSTIYGAVKQAGGSIEVYTEEGRGTTFKIYLPRVEGEVSKPEKEEGPPDLAEGSETVLLVEDDDLVRDMCGRILDQLGYKVLQASNGYEAISLAGEYGGRIDLLLTDVVMPGMNGRDLADRLCRIRPEMKVIFTSGYTDNAIVHHGVLEEGVAFIGKPYSISGLAKKVREVLDKAR